MSKCCIIIPCYNEHDRILGDDFVSFLNKNDNFLFHFVDDGSSDKTFSMLEKLKDKHPRISCSQLKNNEGKAEAVRFGINNTLQEDYTYYGFIDADLAVPLEELKRLYDQISLKKAIEFVYASKNTKLNSALEMKTKRLFVGRVLSLMVRWSLNIDVYDTQCGCKIMTQKLAKISFKERFISSWLFDIEIFWRIIGVFGKSYVAQNTVEIPLQKLHNRGASKVSLVALIKLPLEFFKIHQYYSRKK